MAKDAVKDKSDSKVGKKKVSTAKERKLRRASALSSVKPQEVKEADKETRQTIPFAIKAGLAYFAVTSYVQKKKFEASQKNIAQWESQMRNNFPDGMCAGDRVRYRMKMEDEQRKIKRYEKMMRGRQMLGRCLGRVTGAASTMARTTMMGAGTGIIRADDKGVLKSVITTDNYSHKTPEVEAGA